MKILSFIFIIKLLARINIYNYQYKFEIIIIPLITEYWGALVDEKIGEGILLMIYCHVKTTKDNF